MENKLKKLFEVGKNLAGKLFISNFKKPLKANFQI